MLVLSLDLNQSQLALLENKLEAIMAKQSSMHAYLNWTKQRIDEMDATLASLEAKAGQVKAESKTKAQQTIADLKKRRDEFQAKAKAQAQAGEAALQANKTQLETQWRDFEAQVETYFDTVGKQIGQQQATFREIAAAHAKAWREAADKLHSEATKVAAGKRADVDAAVKQMKADAAEAEARLQKLKQAGSESWAAMSAALAASRKAFDQANQKAWDALRRATPPAA
jgi:chromosome segregation ATPase